MCLFDYTKTVRFCLTAQRFKDFTLMKVRYFTQCISLVRREMKFCTQGIPYWGTQSKFILYD